MFTARYGLSLFRLIVVFKVLNVHIMWRILCNSISSPCLQTQHTYPHQFHSVFQIRAQLSNATRQWERYRLSSVSFWCKVNVRMSAHVDSHCCSELCSVTCNVEVCYHVSLDQWLQTFWKHELTSSSSGKEFKKNLTACPWIWKHYFLRNVGTRSPSDRNPQHHRCKVKVLPITGHERPEGE